MQLQRTVTKAELLVSLKNAAARISAHTATSDVRTLCTALTQLSQDAHKAGLMRISSEADSVADKLSRKLIQPQFSDAVKEHIDEMQTEQEAAESMIAFAEKAV